MVYRVPGKPGDEHGAPNHATLVTIPSGEVALDGALVKVDGFRIDRHLVRRSEYRAYARAAGRRAPPPEPGDDDLPATGISYDEAASYAAWFEGRIPSEAEWQLAAIGFGERAYPSGSGRVFIEERGPTAWRSAYPARRPRAVGAGVPLCDGVFGVSDLGEVWELTSTPAPAGVVVRGGAWRDRTLPPRLDNRSTEGEPAPDVGFRCVYPPDRSERPSVEYPGIPRSRSADESLWRRELFETSDGLRAHLEQAIARLGCPYEVLPIVPDVTHLKTLTYDDILEWSRVHDAAVARMKTSHERRYRIERRGRYYEVYVDGRRIVVTHSRETAGVDGPRQFMVFGETSTRLALEVFVAFHYEITDFIGYVMATFEGNYDSPT